MSGKVVLCNHSYIYIYMYIVIVKNVAYVLRKRFFPRTVVLFLRKYISYLKICFSKESLLLASKIGFVRSKIRAFWRKVNKTH